MKSYVSKHILPSNLFISGEAIDSAEFGGCDLLAYEQSNYLMGRTIPYFRMASVEEQTEWKDFRQALDKSDRKIFDDMFSIAQLYNSACSFAAKPIRIQPIFMSIIFHHYKQLMEIKQELEKKKQ